MNIYVMADRNWVIGGDGKLLASIPFENKTRIKEITGKVIVYTLPYLNQLPGKQALIGTTNFVWAPGTDVKVKGATVFTDIKSLRAALKKYDDEDIFILDGESLYNEFMPDASVVHVTKIDYAYSGNSHFCNLDENPDFVLAADSDELYCFDIVYRFLRYERLAKIYN